MEDYKNMSWKEQLQKSIKNIYDLDKYVNLNSEENKKLSKIIDSFPLLITPYYASIINWNDPKDPIKKIIIPTGDELNANGFFDPSNEKSNSVLPSLQHKYKNTALLLSTSNCAGYCRFCFRRRLKERKDYTADKEDDLTKVFKYIKKHPEIDNVLISGGDPLVLSNERLDYILSEIRKIKHIKIIRLGTRVPVYLPQRITQDKELIKILCKYNFPDKQIYFVTHFNHPNEITNEATKAIKTLINNGIQVKNQTVLLKDVNDNPEILAKLFNNLFYIGIAPYYLLQCRPVIRSSHFRVPIDKGWKIFENK